MNRAEKRRRLKRIMLRRSATSMLPADDIDWLIAECGEALSTSAPDSADDDGDENKDEERSHELLR